MEIFPLNILVWDFEGSVARARGLEAQRGKGVTFRYIERCEKKKYSLGIHFYIDFGGDGDSLDVGDEGCFMAGWLA